MWLIHFGVFPFGKMWKNGHLSRCLQPDWGSTARAAMAGLGSLGLKYQNDANYVENTSIVRDTHLKND